MSKLLRILLAPVLIGTLVLLPSLSRGQESLIELGKSYLQQTEVRGPIDQVSADGTHCYEFFYVSKTKPSKILMSATYAVLDGGTLTDESRPFIYLLETSGSKTEIYDPFMDGLNGNEFFGDSIPKDARSHPRLYLNNPRLFEPSQTEIPQGSFVDSDDGC